MLPDFTSFEVDREIVNYFSYFKKIQKETNIAENSKKNFVEYPINIVGKNTSEIGVPLCWTNQIHNSPFGQVINDSSMSMLRFLDVKNHLAVTHMDQPQVDICRSCHG